MKATMRWTLLSTILLPASLSAGPTVYPTGTTIYHPDRCWSGYTVFQTESRAGAVLIDMNGNEIRRWEHIVGYPVTILPGGYIMGGTVGRVTKEYTHVIGSDDLVQEDWQGNVVWKFGNADEVEVEGRKSWSARQNHDYVREGAPVGYYVPGMVPLVDRGNTLILSQRSGSWPEVTRDYLPRAARIIEVSWDGDVLWEWMPAEHFEEFGHSEAAKNTIMRGCKNQHCVFLNTVSRLGPNRWYDAGDERFAPDNLITDDRGTIVFIISKKTGKIVWKVGPDYTTSEALRKLGPIIGPHDSHMIPRGLPGEGNILIFDNGGAAGFGPPNPGSPTGEWNALRDYSRVLEIDPTTLEIVWEYSARTAGFAPLMEDSRFYSHYASGAQRLPNGNTLIANTTDGRIIEVTRESEIVWEYVSPYSVSDKVFSSRMFRAYRVPYEWIPQLAKPAETAVVPPNNAEFKVSPKRD
jgi:Arylsulfotransferase (ASST)